MASERRCELKFKSQRVVGVGVRKACCVTRAKGSGMYGGAASNTEQCIVHFKQLILEYSEARIQHTANEVSRIMTRAMESGWWIEGQVFET